MLHYHCFKEYFDCYFIYFISSKCYLDICSLISRYLVFLLLALHVWFLLLWPVVWEDTWNNLWFCDFMDCHITSQHVIYLRECPICYGGKCVFTFVGWEILNILLNPVFHFSHFSCFVKNALPQTKRERWRMVSLTYGF